MITNLFNKRVEPDLVEGETVLINGGSYSVCMHENTSSDIASFTGGLSYRCAAANIEAIK